MGEVTFEDVKNIVFTVYTTNGEKYVSTVSAYDPDIGATIQEVGTGDYVLCMETDLSMGVRRETPEGRALKVAMGCAMNKIHRREDVYVQDLVAILEDIYPRYVPGHATAESCPFSK